MIVGGQSLVTSPPVFSHDGKKLLVCTGCTVSVFSTTTGMLITELEGHTERVTSIVVVPVAGTVGTKFSNYCWTASLDGMIFYWDFSTPDLLKKVNVQLPVHSFVIPNILSASLGRSDKASQNLYAFISVEDANKEVENGKHLHGSIQIYDLTNSTRAGGVLAETHKPETLAVSKSGEFVGIKKKQQLNIWRVPNKNLKSVNMKKLKLHHTRTLSCLAFHPTKCIVAAGDVSGRILIWRGFGKMRHSQDGGGKMKIDMGDRPGVRGEDDADSCSTWHWHSSEIKFLMFSSDEAYLFSGAKEGVIVVWQLDMGNKTYKPNIGSPLMYFTDSPDPSLSCVSCEDNQIHLLRMPSMDIIKSISGIKPPLILSELQGDRSRVTIGCDRSIGFVALPTKDYRIQFFSLLDGTDISHLQVIERNYDPVDETTVFISLVEVSDDGSMMSTVEEKLPEMGIGGLISLKFWIRGSHTGQYTLSTIIYEPHNNAGVSDMAFCPGRSMAVSTSYCGNFKVWVNNSSFIHSGDEIQEKGGWRCQSVSSYKEIPMTAAAFSGDGSVLAVAAETKITLWDPLNNVLVAIIGDSLGPIRRLAFVGSSEYIMSFSSGTKADLVVWNISNLSRHWSYKLLVEDICCTRSETRVAVLALLSSSDKSISAGKDGMVLVFDVENPIPVSTWFVKKAKGGRLSFINNKLGEATDGKLLLAYINGEHNYVLFDPSNVKEQEDLIPKSARRPQSYAHDENVSHGYASIYGELPSFDLTKARSSDSIPFVSSKRPWETIFSGSSHALPPLSKLCSPFLESLLEKAEKQTVLSQ
ncbi:WD repeat-containing protein 75 [Rhynchospora pubera]|uniref:WD repeat-containing protein 75 n=1 Tax=Rhynchospora pubera TaxID=906938 RepID=A0AAV8C929_9POAL|nr:WD repeat-containing protein 75 [Rhynchospora pubera]